MRFMLNMLVCQAVVHVAGGKLVVLLYTVQVALPGFEYSRTVLVVKISYSCWVAAESYARRATRIVTATCR